MQTNRFAPHTYLSFLALGSALVLQPASAWVPVYNFYSSPTFYHNQTTYPQIKYPSGAESSGKGSANGGGAGKAKGQNAESKPSAPSRFGNNPLPYVRDRALSSKIREEFLADYASQLRGEAALVRKTTQSNDFIEVMAATVRTQGLDSSNMNSLVAYWYGQSWAIANQQPMPTAKQFQGIAEQLQNSTSQSSKLDKMNNVERQKFFEQLAYPLFFQGAKYELFRKEGNKDYLAQMAGAAQEGHKKTGLNLRSLRLGDNGFVRL